MYAHAHMALGTLEPLVKTMGVPRAMTVITLMALSVKVQGLLS